MKFPVIITNFKTYENAYGQKAVELAKIHEKVARDTGFTFMVAVQYTDITMVSQAVSIPVLAQHIDAVGFGSSTGYVLPEAVKAAGAAGTLINHSERHIGDIARIKRKIERAKEVSLITVVCAQNPTEAAAINLLKPDFVAVEPPALIGGDISVSKADPQIIKDSVAVVDSGKLLVGAGIKDGEDVRIALELGACGVLLASGVTKSLDPEKVLRDLVSKIR